MTTLFALGEDKKYSDGSSDCQVYIEIHKATLSVTVSLIILQSRFLSKCKPKGASCKILIILKVLLVFYFIFSFIFAI